MREGSILRQQRVWAVPRGTNASTVRPVEVNTTVVCRGVLAGDALHREVSPEGLRCLATTLACEVRYAAPGAPSARVVEIQSSRGPSFDIVATTELEAYDEATVDFDDLVILPGACAGHYRRCQGILSVPSHDIRTTTEVVVNPGWPCTKGEVIAEVYLPPSSLTLPAKKKADPPTPWWWIPVLIMSAENSPPPPRRAGCPSQPPDLTGRNPQRIWPKVRGVPLR